MIRFETLDERIKIRLARVAAGMTLFDAGMRAGISPPRLSEFERGRRILPADDLARLQAILTSANEGADDEVTALRPAASGDSLACPVADR